MRKFILPLLALLGMLTATSAQAQVSLSVANEAVTGTTIGKLAKFTATNPVTAVIATTSDTDGVVGIVSGFSLQGSTGITGNAYISQVGITNCTFDTSGVTAKHYVIASTAVGGSCADGGATRPTGVQVIGVAQANGASGASVAVSLDKGFANTAGGGTGANPTATASDVAVNGVASTFLRSDGAPAIQKTSSSVFGLAKVDGTTITASGGVITATAGGSGCTVSGGAGAVYNTGSSACTTATDQQFATGLMTLGVNTSEAGNLKLFGGTSGNVTLAPTAVAGTNVVATFPANTGTLAELNLAQTWTAKQAMTGSGPLELGANSGNVGSVKLFGNTSGDATIVVPAAAGTATRFQLPATNGSNTNVLQTDGSGNTSWAAAGGGGGAVTWISTCTISSSTAACTWTSLTLDNYKLVCWDGIPVTSTANLLLQFSTDNGSTYIGAGYDVDFWNSITGDTALTNQTGLYLSSSSVNTAPSVLQAETLLSGLATSGAPHTARTSLLEYGAGSPTTLVTITSNGWLNGNTTPVNALKVKFDSGNIAKIKCALYSMQIS